MISNTVFVDNIGLCTVYSYLDKKIIYDNISEFDSSDCLIRLNITQNRYDFTYVFITKNNSRIFLSSPSNYENCYFLPILKIGTYIRCNQISPTINNGIYIIILVDSNSNATNRYINYHIKNIITNKVKIFYTALYNLNGIEILIPVKTIKSIFNISIPQVSPLLKMWDDRESLDCDSIDSFSINGQVVHKLAARLFSPVINAMLEMNNNKNSSLYLCDEICTNMFIYLMYNYSLHGYNDEILVKLENQGDFNDIVYLFQQLYTMCDYYGTNSNEYILSLIHKFDNLDKK